MSDDSQKSTRTLKRLTLEPRTVETVMDMLNSEIETTLAAESRPGWSKWGLAGAIAACLWLAVGEFEKGKLEFLTVVYWLLSADFIVSSLRGIVGHFAKWLSHEHRPKRFLSPKKWWEYSTFTKSQLSLVLGYSGILLGIATYFNHAKAYPTHMIVGWVIFGGFLALILIAVIFFNTRWAKKIMYRMPSDDVSFSDLIFQLIISGGILYSGVGFAVDLSTLPLVAHPDILRFSGLLYTVYVCLFLLLMNQPTSALLPYLVSIRRELGIGKISPDQANRRLDIIFAGMQVSDVVEGDIAELLRMNDSLNADTAVCYNCMKELESKYASVPREVRNKDIIFNSLFENLKTKDSSIRQLRKKINERVTEVKSRLRGMRDDADSADVAEVESVLKREECMANERFNKYIVDVESFVKRAAEAKQLIEDTKRVADEPKQISESPKQIPEPPKPE